MRFRAVFKISQAKIKTSSPRFRRSYTPLPERPSFGIAFDIDGVILRGQTPIGGSPHALRRLYNEDGNLKIPFLFLTNGGGIPESKRASELSKLLGIQISPLQIVQGHSPFRELVSRFENELVVAVGKGEPAAVMSEYGFNTRPGKSSKHIMRSVSPRNHNQDTMYIQRELKELLSLVILLTGAGTFRCGGLPGKERAHQPPLYFASDDLEYQATFPSERLGMGAFRIALESIFNRIHSNPLEYTSFGKPNPSVFKNAEIVLMQLVSTDCDDQGSTNEVKGHSFSTIYMIGDNPSVDIKGATKAGNPWFSILTRTGVFRGEDNHLEFPADLVVDTVEDAIDYILRKERA